MALDGCLGASFQERAVAKMVRERSLSWDRIREIALVLYLPAAGNSRECEDQQSSIAGP